MAQDAGVRVIRFQLPQKVQEGAFLRVGARVGRAAMLVQPAFVADADAVVVPPRGMGADAVDRAAHVHLAVAREVEVVADVGKAALPVATAQGLDGKVVITTRGAAMHYQEADLPVVLVETSCFHQAQALMPKAPAMAVATAMMTLSTVLHTDFVFFSII